MKQKFKDALHRYKVEAFRIAHHGADLGDVSKEILEHTRQALENAYHFHFHRDPNPHRVETFQMIREVTVEAILPPVLEKVMRRITILEKHNAQMVKLLDELLELMSEEEPHARAAAKH